MRVTVTNEDFVPELGLVDGSAQEVAQNVAMIISTRKGTCPMARDIGLSYDWIGRGINVAHALVAAEVVEALEEQEPRATLEGITLAESDGETVTIYAEVEIGGE